MIFLLTFLTLHFYIMSSQQAIPYIYDDGTCSKVGKVRTDTDMKNLVKEFMEVHKQVPFEDQEQCLRNAIDYMKNKIAAKRKRKQKRKSYKKKIQTMRSSSSISGPKTESEFNIQESRTSQKSFTRNSKIFQQL